MSYVLIILIILGAIIFLFFVLYFSIKFITFKERDFLLKIKKEFSDTKLIKYKNEIGSISSFNLDQDQTKEIEILWFSIEKLTRENKKNIEETLVLLKKYKFISVFKRIKKIQEKIILLKNNTENFDNISTKILGNVKAIQLNIGKLKKGIRSIKNNNTLNKKELSRRTKEKINNDILFISNLIKKTEASIKNIEEEEYKELFVQLSQKYQSLIFFMNSIGAVDKFLFIFYFQKIKAIDVLIIKTEEQINTNLDLLDIESKKQEISDKWKKAIDLLYANESKIEEVIEIIREINKFILNVEHLINLEKKAYFFIKKNKGIIRDTENEVSRYYMQIKESIETAIKIDKVWFNDNNIQLELDKIVDEINFIKDTIEMEEAGTILSYSKLFYLYKNFLNKVNILNEKLNDEKTKLKIFYYEENSTRLKIELLHKTFIEINFSLEKYSIFQSLKDKQNHLKINKTLEIIQEKTNSEKDVDLEKEYSILYEDFIIYFKENIIKIYKSLLFQNLILEIGYIRSKNLSFHKDVLKAEIFYNRNEYDKALDYLIEKIIQIEN